MSQAQPGTPALANNYMKVFVQRDYSDGTAVKFQTRFPTELESRVSTSSPVIPLGTLQIWHKLSLISSQIDKHSFETTINKLNEYFAEAEKGTCSTYCEGCLACITAYLNYICTETHYEKCLRKVSKYIVSQNERIYNPRGLQITDPTYRGLRVIEISILDRPVRTLTAALQFIRGVLHVKRISMEQRVVEDLHQSEVLKVEEEKMSQAQPGTPALANNYMKVFVQRDYSDGTAVKFQTRFPTELESRIDKHSFETTINKLNEYFAEAEKGTCSTYCEGCLACITAYLNYICTETHYEKCLRKVSKYIVSQNERIYNPRGLQITDPTYRGLRVIEISILDRPVRT
uniref:Ras modification protein ERF4 n=2 Tax=Lutzomyia longipalpis TaxID=7200 RepID=A0A1B0GK53_LUTLO